ncbi:TRAP transporter small permease [Terrarubrum flagellatum]|uniref:TRAP transporter small permease n=1 Tax=Terrirubrum flagellatum TaxID=2895980 RepID=UPI003145658E
MRQIIKRAFDFFSDALPVVLLAIVIIVVTLDVLGREILSAPLYAANEIAVIAFVWLVWFGMIGAARRQELIGVRYFVSLLPPAAARWVDVIVDFLIALICLAILRAAIRQIATARFTTFDLLGLPKWLLTFGVAISVALLAIYYIACGVRQISARSIE